MRRLAVASAALVVLAACSGDPAPIEPKDPASSTASPRPTSTLTPPTLPKPAERKDATGAANFVLYWVKVSNYAALTGDTDLLRTISAPDCEGCKRYIDLYERTYAAGGYFRGGSRTVEHVNATADGNDFYISADLQAEAGSFKLDSSASRRASEAETTSVTFRATRDDSSWSMTDIGLSP